MVADRNGMALRASSARWLSRNKLRARHTLNRSNVVRLGTDLRQQSRTELLAALRKTPVDLAFVAESVSRDKDLVSALIEMTSISGPIAMLVVSIGVDNLIRILTTTAPAFFVSERPTT